MVIGGIDLVFELPADVPAAELILRRVEQFWPNALFQDVEEDKWLPVQNSEILVRRLKSQEFFLYRDRAAAESWAAEGAAPTNQNTMLHFLIRTHKKRGSAFQSITLVCDEKTPEIEQLLSDLKGSMSPITPSPVRAA
jgi:hypothetical protein